MTEPVVAQKGPYEVELRAGEKYFWCACGRSARQPYCDGSHKGTAHKPHVFVAETTGAAWLCGCKTSKSRPFCDGSHESL